MSPTLPHHRSERENAMPALARGVVWIVVQLLPFACLLLHMPLWARSPRPLEQFAPAALLGVQMLASALLFPWLLDRRGSALFAIGTAVIFNLVATIGAEEQTLSRWLLCSLIIAGWLAGLALAARTIRHPLWLTFASAILALVAPPIAFVATA